MYASYSTYEQIRKDRGLRDSDVCKRTGISSATMSDWKKGRYTPKADKLQAIANVLEVSFEMLTTGEDSKHATGFDIDALTQAIEKSLRKQIIRKYHEPQSGYYTDPETARLAQEMYDDPEMRSLFHMKRNMEPEKFKAHIDMMKKMYALEHPEDDDYGA